MGAAGLAAIGAGACVGAGGGGAVAAGGTTTGRGSAATTGAVGGAGGTTFTGLTGVCGNTILGAGGSTFGGAGGGAAIGALAAGASAGLASTGCGAVGGAGGCAAGGCAAGDCLLMMALSTSPGLEMWDRSILVLISSDSARLGRPSLAEVCDSPEARSLIRTFSASCSSKELECVFFSVTPISVRTSRIALLLTSSSLARSLIRTLLIRPRFSFELSAKSSFQPHGISCKFP